MNPHNNYGIAPTPMLPDAIVAGCIEIYENVWTDCSAIIDSVENECVNHNSGIHWNKSSTIGDGVMQDQRTNYDMSITYNLNTTNNETMRIIHNRMCETLNSAMISYHNRNQINESFWFEGFNLLKYQTGQEYKLHYDSSTGLGRHVSAILYLNDNYEGGFIEFPNFNIKIKPVTGMLMLFPSNFAYGHIAHPVVQGTKYALVTWLHDRPIE